MIKTVLVFFISFLGIAAGVYAFTSQDYCDAGMRLYQQRQYGKAAQYFQAAIQMDPNNWQAYEGLGYCVYDLDDKDGAKRDFARSLALHPDNPPLRKFAFELDATYPPGDDAPSPFPDGRRLSLGLFAWGFPAYVGVTGKYWLSGRTAVEAGFSTNTVDGSNTLDLKYLWHEDFDLYASTTSRPLFYYGAGGVLSSGGVALVVPLGFAYLFVWKANPIEVDAESDFLYWVAGGGGFQVKGGLASRCYLF